ncbi:MAG: hypothetical protein RL755_64 [Pseudomonadota bacterium]|jgi:hypothetical protein
MTNSQISPAAAARELLARRKARVDLHAFIQYINPDYIVSEFSRTVCNELMQFIDDVNNGKRPIIVFGAPPQNGKSTIVSRYFPAFLHGINSNLSIAGVSYNSDLAEDMGRDVQRIINSDEYKRLFPSSMLGQKKKGVASKQNSTAYEIGEKGTYRGIGVGGGLVGRKVDIGIIDDPIKNSQEALSETVKAGIWSWYLTAFLSRLSKNSGHIIMETRWAIDDLSGKVLENDPQTRHLVFKAISDDGKALVPELHPIEKLEKTRATVGVYFWEALYQQNPMPPGGLFFNESDLLENGLPVSYPANCQQIITVLDTAVKTGKKNDSTAVIHCAFIQYPEPRLIILDWDAVQIEGGSLITWLPSVIDRSIELGVQCKARHGSSIWIEDRASGSILLQQCANDGIPANAIPEIFTAKMGKSERAIAASPYVFSGKVRFSEHAYDKIVVLKDQPKNHLLNQIVNFRIGIDNGADDLLDTAMYAILLTLKEDH